MATATGFPVKDLKEATARSWAQVVGAAECPRCGGLMVTEPCVDLLDSGHLDVLARRCVQCGEVIDPVILENRRRLRENTIPLHGSASPELGKRI